MNKIKLAVIAGPTASGKTKMAVEVAQDVKADIVSADSMLVYRGMDIGTAKPSLKQRKLVKHHIIDVASPRQDYSVSDYTTDALEAITKIRRANKNFLVCGGTGFYINALINGNFKAPKSDPKVRENLEQRLKKGETLFDLHKELTKIDPETALRVHENDSYRVLRALEVYYGTGKTMTYYRTEHKDNNNANFEPFIVILNPTREELYERIQYRTNNMFKYGLIEETQELLREGFGPQLKPMKSIGYLQAVQIIQGRINISEAKDDINKQTMALAKRQITWFRKQPHAKWFPSDRIEDAKKEIKAFICS